MNTTTDKAAVGIINTAKPGHEAGVKAAMDKAFALVCPATRAKALAAAGKITEEHAARVSWKDRIGCIVTQAQLDAAGVSIDRIKAAIEFFTATEATVEYSAECWISGTKTGPGYFVEAKGYRMGPAGDH